MPNDQFPESDGKLPEDPQNPQIQQVQTRPLTARVPEPVRRGVFSSGMIVITGPTEFVLDFIQNIGPPAQVVARVIVPHAVMPQFIEALRRNWQMYIERFGTPSEPPRAAVAAGAGRRLTLEEIYDELKIPDELLSGAYANGLMIGHSASEFKLDFLTNMYPHSAVSCRVYLAAPQIPRIIESLHVTFVQFQQRLAQQRAEQERRSGSGPTPPSQPPAAG
ncbi:MAG: hypothetical protein KatS3mg110_3950 [Pirellulaceae bacterium]|nr:MAG: hypothetical protein KatS3mg110_3950 [Pirellulaceae bacterium]